MYEENNVILSAKDVEVKFRVRDNYLTAIRNVSLDLYNGETFAIVGESGSGKSVFTKTFTGAKDNDDEDKAEDANDETVISDIYEEGSDGIIDKLFQQNETVKNEEPIQETEHKVDPDEYVLYKKYL